ncbi:transcriptional regulator, LysR family [Variovorax sp. CF079]|uniref:LysR family transcriptional regulator n=1 Tax=Variovorax sp. CF079 TaxID=1882774 RepID=UPI00087F74B8|nr:LysR family transcriptional regulator [Variovorax sp. CF079]SDE93795.1 transcriptional regulator, LysR family [Variovorax sp. CF079]
MNSGINLRAVDLNLLVLFDALMAESHVTRAADRVGVSQSAMSNALARLRFLFKDELFIRTSRGMEPTPRAVELGEGVRSILQQTSRLMASDVSFDAQKSQHQFVARMSDLVGSLVLPALMGRLSHAAPGVSLDVVHMSPEKTVEALELDQLDVAVSMDLTHGNTIRYVDLLEDKMVCLMRQDHPMAGRRLTLERFLASQHVRVSMSPTDMRFVDSVLAEQGQQRKIMLNLPHWLLVPQVLQQTDYIAVMSERAALRVVGADLVVRPLPFQTESFAWRLYWHKRHEHSRSHQWLRTQLEEVCAAVQGRGTPRRA